MVLSVVYFHFDCDKLSTTSINATQMARKAIQVRRIPICGDVAEKDKGSEREESELGSENLVRPITIDII